MKPLLRTKAQLIQHQLLSLFLYLQDNQNEGRQLLSETDNGTRRKKKTVKDTYVKC